MLDLFAYSLKYYFTKGEMPSEKQTGKLIVKYFTKQVKKHPAKKRTRTITITTRKYKDGWKIAKETNTISDTYGCDFISGFNDAGKKIKDAF